MTNYSFETSLPAYKDNGDVKQLQEKAVLTCIQNKAQTIREIASRTGMVDSTVSGRVNDLISKGLIKYDGTVVYADRKRKRIVLL